MKNFLHDFRFGVRLLLKKPRFTLAALLALALGIGANTAIYSIFYATLIADFPYPHSEQLVVVWSRAAGTQDRNTVSAGDYLDWKRESTVSQSSGVVRGSTFNLSIGETPVLAARQLGIPQLQAERQKTTVCEHAGRRPSPAGRGQSRSAV